MKYRGNMSDSGLPTDLNPAGAVHPAGEAADNEPGKTKPKEAQAEAKPKGLLLERSKLVPVTLRTPEVKAEPVELSQKSADTLIDTTAYHLDYIHELETTEYEKYLSTVAVGTIPQTREQYLSANLTAQHQELFKLFRLKYRDLKYGDLHDPDAFLKAFKEKNPEFEKQEHPRGEYYDAVKTLISELFDNKENREASVVMALELGRWETATLQAASARLFKQKKGWFGKPKLKKIKSIIETETDDVTVSSSGIKAKSKRQKEVSVSEMEYERSGGDTFDMSHLNNQQQKFLAQRGWNDNTVASRLSPEEAKEQLKALDKRLLAVADVSIELLTKTGLSIDKFDLNFIKDTSTPTAIVYKDMLIPHFINETHVVGGNAFADVLEAGKKTTEEIKNKTEEKIRKTLEKSQEATASETIVGRIDAEIKKKSPDVPLAEKDARTALIDVDVKALQDELTRLLDYPSLDPKIQIEQRKLNLLSTQIQAKLGAVSIALGQNFTTADELIKYLTDAAVSDGLKHWQLVKEELEREKNSIEVELGKNESRRNAALQNLKNIPVSQQKGGALQPLIDITPIQTNIKQIEEIITAYYKKLFVTWSGNNAGGNKTLNDLIVDADANIKRINDAVAVDSQLKQFIEEYKATKIKSEELSVAKIKTETELIARGITPTDQTQRDTRAETLRNQMKKKEEEKANLGVKTEDISEIKTLKALRTAYDPKGKTGRENRVAKAERHALKPPLEQYNLSYDPEWQRYPPAILRAVQLIWGDEILLPNPQDKELLAQVQTLIRSKKYLSIIINAVENEITQNLPIGSVFQSVDHTILANQPTIPLTDAELITLFSAPSSIIGPQIGTRPTMHLIDKKVVDKIIEDIARRALSITVVS